MTETGRVFSGERPSLAWLALSALQIALVVLGVAMAVWFVASGALMQLSVALFALGAVVLLMPTHLRIGPFARSPRLRLLRRDGVAETVVTSWIPGHKAWTVVGLCLSVAGGSAAAIGGTVSPLVVAFVVFVAIWNLVRLYGGSWADGSLHLSAEGLSQDTGRRPVTLGWSQVRSVAAGADGVVLETDAGPARVDARGIGMTGSELGLLLEALVSRPTRRQLLGTADHADLLR